MNIEAADMNDEHNFCSRCGKYVAGRDGAHTCTPPSDATIAYHNTNAHLEAKVAMLEAEADSWEQQAQDRTDDALRFARERPAGAEG